MYVLSENIIETSQFAPYVRVRTGLFLFYTYLTVMLSFKRIYFSNIGHDCLRRLMLLFRLHFIDLRMLILG